LPKLILITLILLFHYQVFASSCDEKFEKLRPKLDELKQVVLCDSSFTLQECQENIGLKAGVGVAAAKGTAVGFKSGRQLLLKKPAFCGLKGASNIWKLLLVQQAYAACENPFSNHASEVDQILDDDEKLRNYQLGKELEARVARDNPKLVEAESEIRRYQRLYFNEGEIDPKTNTKVDEKYLREMKRNFIEKYGFWGGHTVVSPCEGPKEICSKFTVLNLAKHPTDLTAKTLTFNARVGSYYSNDPELRAKMDSIKKVEAIRAKIKSGLVKNADELASLYQESARTMSEPFKERMAAAAGRAYKSFPQVDAFKKLSGDMQQSFSSYVKEGKLNLLKRGLPGVIAGLLPLAASAADCTAVGKVCAKTKESIELIGKAADELAPDKLLGAKALGCAEMYSTYSTVGDDCKEVVAFTPNLKTFLMADSDLQKSEVCHSSRFENLLNDLHRRTFQNYNRVNCGSNSVTMMDDKLKRNVKFTFNGDQLINAQVNGEFENHYGYDLNFSSAGNLTGSKIKTQSGGRTFQYYDEKKIKNNPKVDALLEDFSTRLPVAFSKWNDCKNGTLPAGTGDSNGSSATGNR
jgi:hypothetical protein